MSKRLKNYPEPGIVINKFGADALRLYLINSPVVRAETLKFKEEGVKEIIARVFLPWYNAFKFFITQAHVLKQVIAFGTLSFFPSKTVHHDSSLFALFDRTSDMISNTRLTPRSPKMSWIVGCLLHANPWSNLFAKRWTHTVCTLSCQGCWLSSTPWPTGMSDSTVRDWRWDFCQLLGSVKFGKPILIFAYFVGRGRYWRGRKGYEHAVWSFVHSLPYNGMLVGYSK